MLIFHSYVKLPEGMSAIVDDIAMSPPQADIGMLASQGNIGNLCGFKLGSYHLSKQVIFHCYIWWSGRVSVMKMGWFDGWTRMKIGENVTGIDPSKFPKGIGFSPAVCHESHLAYQKFHRWMMLPRNEWEGLSIARWLRFAAERNVSWGCKPLWGLVA